MLRSAKSMIGYQTACLDGVLGTVDDLLFHDTEWSIRYLVVNPNPLLPGRKVLLPPAAAGRPDWASRSVPLNYTREQVRNSPPIDAERPVSRQQEAELHRFFQWIPYWGPAGTATHPFAVPVEKKDLENPGEATRENDPALRSFGEVAGYSVSALDGSLGHLEDMIFDDERWLFHLFVVDTRNWWPGKHVVLDTEWIGRIDHTEKAVHVDLGQQNIKAAPEYNPSEAVNEEYQQQLYDYYGRPKRNTPE